MEKLIHGEALEEMQKLIDDGVKVDCIITDPPYEFVQGGCSSKKVNGGKKFAKGGVIDKTMANFKKKQVIEMLEVTKNIFNGSYNGYFFCSKLQLPYYLNWAYENKLKYDLLIWDRDVSRMLSSKFYSSDIDYVVRIYGKNRGLNNLENIENKYMYYKKITKLKQGQETEHPTEKPIELLKKYILLSTNENDIVLDMYMGSGSVGVACKNLNRKFIGIELAEWCYNIAVERIDSTIVEEKFAIEENVELEINGINFEQESLF